MSIIHLIASDNYIVVNRDLLWIFDLKTAVFLGELASEFLYYETSEKVDEMGFFFSTVENVETRTGLSKYEQAAAIKNLTEAGILEIERRGLPAKRYFKINEQGLLNCLQDGKNFDIRQQTISQQEVKKFDILRSKNLTSYTYNKNTEYKSTQNKNKEIYKESPATLENEFETLWKQYPRKLGKKDARAAYIRYRKKGTTFEEVQSGLNEYNNYIKRNNKALEYIKHGSSWFNGRHWEDDYSSAVQTTYGGRFTTEKTPFTELDPNNIWHKLEIEERHEEFEQWKRNNKAEYEEWLRRINDGKPV